MIIFFQVVGYNLKKYKMKHIPKNSVILKTQDMSQNKTKL